MNANELADELVNTDYTTLKAECATMLRQQQAEITDLRQQVAFLEDWRAVWAPVIRQHQGLKWKRYDWRNVALTMLIFFSLVLS